ncbi:MAG: hypothetical protein JXD18_14125 [Anaerolineae bacterium]|nr:hypothetical protein [Anaerolineae bacterium]
MKHLTYQSTIGLVILCAVFLAFYLLPLASAQAQGPVRIIFLHHSCGQNLIEQGGVREGLSALGYEFYDHGYNEEGLRLADGSTTGTHFDVPDDNTNPDGLAVIFGQPLHDPPDNTFSYLMQYDVIIFKSCYPTSNIGSDDQLAEDQAYYLSMRDRMDQYPDKLFIVVTQPPQVPGSSDAEEAERARALADWLASSEFLAGHPNVVTFDFFGLLAGSDNFLRPEYRYDDTDGHPNEMANQAIGPLFVNFVDQVIQGAWSGEPRPEATPIPGEAATEPPLIIAELSAAGVIDDFEGEFAWGADGDGASAVACGADDAARPGTLALQLAYGVDPGGWVGCGRYYDEPQDWSGATGLALWLRADSPGQWVTLNMFSGSAEAGTPFVLDVEVPTEWTQVVAPWGDFARADWADLGGLDVFDPARVTSLSFTVGAQEERNEGTLWADDIMLVTGEGAAPVPGPGEAQATPGAPAEGSGEEPGGGLCAGAALLPLGGLAVVLSGRRRR